MYTSLISSHQFTYLYAKYERQWVASNGNFLLYNILQMNKSYLLQQQLHDWHALGHLPAALSNAYLILAICEQVGQQLVTLKVCSTKIQSLICKLSWFSDVDNKFFSWPYSSHKLTVNDSSNNILFIYARISISSLSSQSLIHTYIFSS